VWVTGGSDGYIVRARNYGDTPWGWTDQYADTIEPSKAEWFLPDEAIETAMSANQNPTNSTTVSPARLYLRQRSAEVFVRDCLKLFGQTADNATVKRIAAEVIVALPPLKISPMSNSTTHADDCRSLRGEACNCGEQGAARKLEIDAGSVTVRVELYAGGRVRVELEGSQWGGFAMIEREDWSEIVRHVKW
jgi:hypothetical protein